MKRTHRKGKRVKGINMLWGSWLNGCDFLVKMRGSRMDLITNDGAGEMTVRDVNGFLKGGAVYIAIPIKGENGYGLFLSNH